MNVLALCADPGIAYDGTKGASVHLREIWHALAAEGATVHGVARNDGAMPPDARVHLLAVSAETRAGATMAERVRARVDAALVSGEAPLPGFVFERLALGSTVGAELAHRLGVPFVLEVNAPLDEEAVRHRGAVLDAGIRRALEASLAAAAVVACVSRPLVEWAVAGGAARGRVLVVPNGVPVDRFAGQRIDPGPGAPTRVAFVGSFKPWHGLDVLLDAFAGAIRRGARLELDLVGDGPVRAALEVEVARLGLASSVHFLGARPHEDVAVLLRRAEIAVAPAPADVEPYFSPLKVYEYAAAGCAIIAARGQAGERLLPGRQILLVEPGDTKGLTDALVLLAADRQLRRSLGAAARARAEAEFDWRLVARRILDAAARELPPERAGRCP